MCVHISEWVCFSLMKTCVFLDHWHPRVNCLKRCVCVCWNSCSLEGIQVSGEKGWTSVMCVWICRVGFLKLPYPLTLIEASQMWPVEMLRWDEMLISMAVSNAPPAALQYITSRADKWTIFLFSSHWVAHNSTFCSNFSYLLTTNMPCSAASVYVCFDDRW